MKFIRREINFNLLNRVKICDVNNFNILLPAIKSYWTSWYSLTWLRNSAPSLGPSSSMPCSPEPAIGSYPEPY
jgi:hypothetical protein